MKIRYISIILGLSISAYGSITVTASGSDSSESMINAEKKAVQKYQGELIQSISACRKVETKPTADVEDYDIVEIGRDNIKKSALSFSADYEYDVEPKEDVPEALENKCNELYAEELAVIEEARQDEIDRKESEKSSKARSRALNSFGSMFNFGIEAYGLYGYGAGAYAEFRPNAYFSLAAIGSYNKVNNLHADKEKVGETISKGSGEIISVGGEVKLLNILGLGYEQVQDSSYIGNNIGVIKRPTSALKVSVTIPYDVESPKDFFNGSTTPRFEVGIYYKQYNDTLLIDGEEQTNSYVGGVIVRVRVF